MTYILKETVHKCSRCHSQQEEYSTHLSKEFNLTTQAI